MKNLKALLSNRDPAKTFNFTFTIFVFLLPILASEFFRWESPTYFPKLNYFYVIPAALLIGACWGIIVNHFFLPWLMQGRILLKSFSWMLLEAWMGIATLMFAHALSLGLGQEELAKSFLNALLMPLAIAIWVSPLLVPFWIACSLINWIGLRKFEKVRD